MHIYFLNVLNTLRQSGLITSNESIASALGLKTDSVARAVSGDTRYFNKRFIYKFCLYYGVKQSYIETGQGDMFIGSSFDSAPVPSSSAPALPIVDKLNLVVSILNDIRQQNTHLQEEIRVLRSQVSYLETRFKSRDYKRSVAGEIDPEYPRRKPTGSRRIQDSLDDVLADTFVKTSPTSTPPPNSHSSDDKIVNDHPIPSPRIHPDIIPDDSPESAQTRISEDNSLPPHLDLI